MGEIKRLKGRPALKQGKRGKKIDVRFTEDEFKLICDLEKELGISKTELIRLRVLNNAGNLVINVRSLLGELDSAGAEMGRIGNNINQLARHANYLKLQNALTPFVAGRFNDLMEEYLKIQQALEVSLRKIIRAMGR